MFLLYVYLVSPQPQYIFIHHALSELVVCGETEVEAANLRIKANQLQKETADGITGFQKHFQVFKCAKVCVLYA